MSSGVLLLGWCARQRCYSVSNYLCHAYVQRKQTHITAYSDFKMCNKIYNPAMCKAKNLYPLFEYRESLTRHHLQIENGSFAAHYV